MGDVRKDRRTSQERKRKIYICKELFLPHMLYIKYLSIMDKSPSTSSTYALQKISFNHGQKLEGNCSQYGMWNVEL